MPLASLSHPSLALSQIKAQLTEAGLHSKIYNFNMDFAKSMGEMSYEMVAGGRGFNTRNFSGLMEKGEWLFAEAAWGRKFGPTDEEFWSISPLEPHLVDDLNNPQEWMCSIKYELVPDFLDQCCSQLSEDGTPEVLGFTTKFFQTIPALALIRLIKEKFPKTKIVLGGPSVHGEMGVEIIEKFPQIDAISTGEADDTIVELFLNLLQNKYPKNLQGIIYRNEKSELQFGPISSPITQEQLEKIPDPDFSEYFEDLNRTGLIHDKHITSRTFLPYESSRGCWWGEIQHCTFCGLNGEGMGYRAKSAHRVINQLKYFANTYPVRRFEAADNILPMSYFKDLLPQLKENPVCEEPIQLAYEIKANLKEDQIRLLKDAQVRFIQPGIESLSSHVLELMRKGVKAIQNVHTLKMCRIHGVVAIYYILYGFPGETREDYEKMASLVPKIIHFQPPQGGPRRVELHRWSPFHFETNKFVKNIRPKPWYKALYPEDVVDLNKVAYYFNGDWKNRLSDEVYESISDKMWTWIDCWRDLDVLPKLEYTMKNETQMMIFDSRFGRNGHWSLSEKETGLFQALQSPISFSKLWKHLQSSYKNETELKSQLNEFVTHDLVLQEGNLYLGLAIPPESSNPPKDFRNHFYHKHRVIQDGINQSETDLTFQSLFLKTKKSKSTMDEKVVS